MTKIFKYELEITGLSQPLLLPDQGQIVSVAAQNGKICLWVLFVLGADKFPQTRHFSIRGTGHVIQDGVYIGTAHIPPFVWHVFEIAALQGKDTQKCHTKS